MSAVQDALRCDTVVGLKSLLEGLEMRLRASAKGDEIRNLELCARMVQGKLDMAARFVLPGAV